ncbi:hypothetical protein NKG94_09065 [Micromonospora sp. M12]
MLRHPSDGGTALTGYDLPGMAARWQVPVPPGELTLRACQGLICGQDERSRWAIEPGTGARVWTWTAGARWHTVAGPRVPTEPLVLLGAASDGRRSLVATVGRDAPGVRGAPGGPDRLPPGRHRAGLPRRQRPRDGLAARRP